MSPAWRRPWGGWVVWSPEAPVPEPGPGGAVPGPAPRPGPVSRPGRPRPGRLVVVTGTGTGVGKTWVGAALLEQARARGLSVAARKPAQSFMPSDRQPDALVLAMAAGCPESEVCPPARGYPAPMAPPMAAAALGRPRFTIGDLLAETVAWWAASGSADLGLVEGAGGVASPLADDGDTADLARALQPDLAIVVADAALGVINAVRLTVAHLRPLPVVVHLNRFDPADDLHRRNRSWLTDRVGLAVTVTPAELLEAVGPFEGVELREV